MSQHMEALAMANEKRSAKSKLKREVRDGKLGIDSLILDPPEPLHKPKRADQKAAPTVSDVLAWQRGWGPSRVKDFCLRNRISRSVCVVDLSPYTKRRIIAGLREKGAL